MSYCGSYDPNQITIFASKYATYVSFTYKQTSTAVTTDDCMAYKLTLDYRYVGPIDITADSSKGLQIEHRMALASE